ncbi:MAG TPA: hypothetical protein VMU96_03635 [Casimicrobiaceae bacterium]|nr:hypothetical protein [Casimicrobiaceae bacterium]
MPQGQPSSFIYYLDANLDGPDLVTTLRGAGMSCEAHRDHFAQDAADEDWIPAVAAKGWVIVTRDFAIKRRPTERAAWTAANEAWLRGKIAYIAMIDPNRGAKLRADLDALAKSI